MSENEMPRGQTCGLPESEEELRKSLTPEQYRIMRQNGTERPFANEYWDNHREGLYVDRISGRALFSSRDKFDSGTGWPSFSAPLDRSAIIESSDRSHGMTRTEVRSSSSNSHLGHLFDDGPAPSRQRYCVNSASLRFIPAERLQAEGYGEYLGLFDAKPVARRLNRFKPAEEERSRGGEGGGSRQGSR